MEAAEQLWAAFGSQDQGLPSIRLPRKVPGVFFNLRSQDIKPGFPFLVFPRSFHWKVWLCLLYVLITLFGAQFLHPLTHQGLENGATLVISSLSSSSSLLLLLILCWNALYDVSSLWLFDHLVVSSYKRENVSNFLSASAFKIHCETMKLNAFSRLLLNVLIVIHSKAKTPPSYYNGSSFSDTWYLLIWLTVLEGLFVLFCFLVYPLGVSRRT